MNTQVTRSVSVPLRENLKTVADIWGGSDKGLIFCWEQGRRERSLKPKTAERAEKGELLPVGQSEEDGNGVWKRGSLQYLACWQGLRGEDLNISLVQEIVFTCSKTGKTFKFPRPQKNVEE